jgi:hypothetical protein
LEAELRALTITAVVGPIGLGKSSVVLAGLVPPLREQGWRIAACRTLSNPLRELVLGLAPLLEPTATSLDSQERLAEEWNRRLTEDPDRILEPARRLAEGGGAGQTLLVVDQFEQLFNADAPISDEKAARNDVVASQDGSPQRTAFLRILDAIAGQDMGQASVRAVVTLRGDLKSRAPAIDRLAERLGESVVELGPMTLAELTETIRTPARIFGVGFADGLVEEILAGLKGRPGALPLLQFGLDRLWRRQRGRRLSWKDHCGTGGKGWLETTLNEHAEAVLAGIRQNRDVGADAEGRVSRVMLRLVRLGEGDGTPDVARVIDRSEIPDGDWPLVKRLARARLVAISHDGETGPETIEMAHEALIAAWRRFRVWLDADRAFGLWRQRLNVELDRWSVLREEGAPAGSDVSRGHRLAR